MLLTEMEHNVQAEKRAGICRIEIYPNKHGDGTVLPGFSVKEIHKTGRVTLSAIGGDGSVAITTEITENEVTWVDGPDAPFFESDQITSVVEEKTGRVAYLAEGPVTELFKDSADPFGEAPPLGKSGNARSRNADDLFRDLVDNRPVAELALAKMAAEEWRLQAARDYDDQCYLYEVACIAYVELPWYQRLFASRPEKPKKPELPENWTPLDLSTDVLSEQLIEEDITD